MRFALAILFSSALQTSFATQAPTATWDSPGASPSMEGLKKAARSAPPVVGAPVATTHTGGVLAAQGETEAPEGTDVQSPEELAAARRIIDRDFADAIDPTRLPAAEIAAILRNYQHLDRRREVPKNLLETAVVYFHANRKRFPNARFITVVDFRPRSDNARLFVVNMEDGEVEKYRTSHGAGSVTGNRGYARSFGNVSGSHKSSLGFARVAETYVGRVKRAVRLDGLSPTNSKLRPRAIVIHGSNYVHEEDVIQGLSEGCMALDWDVKDHILDEIKQGSLLYSGLSEPEEEDVYKESLSSAISARRFTRGTSLSP